MCRRRTGGSSRNWCSASSAARDARRLTEAVHHPAVSTVEPAVVDVLRVGAYQLAFLTHVPKHAAVNETVDLARHVGSPMARGSSTGCCGGWPRR
ncbi:MAG: transcription antitermination factor NusB [Gemmataceae bacterium]